ncbi:hypothetical protein [Agrobacterium tumefaciens]|uniref:hypothetical protein n=1 Tax=Agrobacterium tumefaciens TaxID=358 RepID=UPI0021CF17C6|nr:hypothetical protein [Agrobacterium tumefaciens]
MECSAARESRPDSDLERLADDAVAACGGDMREAIKALVADNISLEQELEFAALAMSFGFSRGWFAKRREARFHTAQDDEGDRDRSETGDGAFSAGAHRRS